MKKRKSIRAQFGVFIALTLVSYMVVVTMSNILVKHSMDSTQDFYVCNKKLTEFYSTVTAADLQGREALYSEEEVTQKKYQELYGKAEEVLEELSEYLDEKTAWRMELLRNMLEYFDSPMQGYLDGVKSRYGAYKEMQYRSRLILQTATEYYGYLAEYMQNRAEEMEHIQKRQKTIQGSAVLVMLTAVCFMVHYCLKYICYPIDEMVENVKKIQKGEYELAFSGVASSELEILSEAFGEMALQIQKNFDTLKEKNKLKQELLKQENENLLMKNLVTEAELRLLQSQINPHFLFNTLSMISKSAYISGNMETYELMEKLSEFLRYALDKTNKNSSLYEEIAALKNYLFIQQKRFQGRIIFSLDVKDEVPDIRMPAIVLQPIVENAIIHGAGNLTDIIEISIKIRCRQGRIIISIEDNGAGMEAERMEQILAYLRCGVEVSSNGKEYSIGLGNVYKRLRMFFGDCLRFDIDSEPNCGTVVTLSIPLEEKISCGEGTGF